MLGVSAHQGAFWKLFYVLHRRSKRHPNGISRAQRSAKFRSCDDVKSPCLASAAVKQGHHCEALLARASMRQNNRDVLIQQLEMDLMALQESCADLMVSKPEITGLGKTKLRLQKEVPYCVCVCML